MALQLWPFVCGSLLNAIDGTSVLTACGSTALLRRILRREDHHTEVLQCTVACLSSLIMYSYDVVVGRVFLLRRTENVKKIDKGVRSGSLHVVGVHCCTLLWGISTFTFGVMLARCSRKLVQYGGADFLSCLGGSSTGPCTMF